MGASLYSFCVPSGFGGRCSCDVFGRGGELSIFLFCHLDLLISSPVLPFINLYLKIIYSSDLHIYIKISHLGAVDILSWIILCYGYCPQHCRVFSRIIGLSQLNANSSPHEDSNASLDVVKYSLGANVYLIEKHYYK